MSVQATNPEAPAVHAEAFAISRNLIGQIFGTE